MADSTDTRHPDTPTTERALPAEGDTTASPRAVPTPAEARAPETRDPGSAPAARPVARSNGRPTDPEEMRREIERTRARMSGTLDVLEARLSHERRQLEQKADEVVDRVTLKKLRRTLSRDPWRSMAIAFVAGYVVAAIRD